MNSPVAIRCEHIGKRYRLGERETYKTLRDSLASLVSSSRHRAAQATLWALDDVSFEVAPGAVLGIIGRNGAGKSTLLKILSRVTRPTRGRVLLHGHVASLLEVGTGFHPELTGRENIFLNGAILGMKRKEIIRRFDEIVAFAELERFLDTPVKRYSSGMYMRLAFAVAAHLEPEILIVDEVLAVGDAAFQKKCLGKMSTVASTGRTVLFVSHSMPAVQSLCQDVIWLDAGKVVERGRPADVIRQYLGSNDAGSTDRIWEDPASAPGNDRVRLRRARVHPDGRDLLSIQRPVVLEFEYWNLVPNAHMLLSVFLYNEQGVLVLNAEPVNETQWRGEPFPVGLFRDVCVLPANVLNDGRYHIDLAFARDESILIHRIDSLLTFDLHDVDDRQRAWYGQWAGVVRPKVLWTTTMLSEGYD
jgi:lipopolysaccharide transport system ATP-binding protein